MTKSLFERRRALGLTTTAVAALAGLSRQTVRNYERNRGNYVAQKYERLISTYDRLERKKAGKEAEVKAEDTNDGRL